ncbi:MAG: hypothetical protein WD530_06060 [Vicingaceae bacterium]
MNLIKPITALFLLTIFISCGSEDKKSKEKESKTSQNQSESNKTPKIEKHMFEFKLISHEDNEGNPSFEPREVNVPPNSIIKVYYQNESRSTTESKHNFVLVEEGMEKELMEVVKNEGYENPNDYVKNHPFIHAFSRMIEAGEEIAIEVETPANRIYTYLCTAPDHYPSQMGKLKVD